VKYSLTNILPLFYTPTVEKQYLINQFHGKKQNEKGVIMTIKGRFFLVLVMVCASLTITVVVSPVFSCTQVPGTRYNMPNIDTWLREAVGFLGGCSQSSYDACREADKRLREADVAIVQILTECTTGNCLRGSLDALTDRAARLADLSRRLVMQSGMRRTYDNTLVTVNSWRGTRMCPVARCQKYASTAVSQNQENLAKKCGFTGTSWSSDYKGHYDWCFTAPQNLADSETRARADALKQCKPVQANRGPACQKYASTAVSQNQQNIAKKCGYGGGRWTPDHQGHYTWCLSVQQSVADSETQARADALKQCKPGPKTVSCPGPGMTVVHKFVDPPPYGGYFVICRDGSGKLWKQGADAAPITSLTRGRWNSQISCYDGTKIVVSSRTIEGRLCKP